MLRSEEVAESSSHSFALKTGECLRVTGNLLRQELEGDETTQPRVLTL
jgi:hypothetical protein